MSLLETWSPYLCFSGGGENGVEIIGASLEWGQFLNGSKDEWAGQHRWSFVFVKKS